MPSNYKPFTTLPFTQGYQYEPTATISFSSASNLFHCELEQTVLNLRLHHQAIIPVPSTLYRISVSDPIPSATSINSLPRVACKLMIVCDDLQWHCESSSSSHSAVLEKTSLGQQRHYCLSQTRP